MAAMQAPQRRNREATWCLPKYWSINPPALGSRAAQQVSPGCNGHASPPLRLPFRLAFVSRRYEAQRRTGFRDSMPFSSYIAAPLAAACRLHARDAVKPQQRVRVNVLALLAAVLALAGCDFPRDAESTLERIRAEGVLRVGATERPPWVLREGVESRGIEPRVISAFADTLGAKVEWVAGSESTLAKALESRRIDVMIGGYTRDTPWKKHLAATQPYLTSRIVVAAPLSSAPPVSKDELEGRVIAYHAGRADIAGRLEAIGAKPMPVDRFGDALAAIYEFESGRLRLTPTRIELQSEKHVMLAAPGESRFLLELDRFLSKQGRRLALAAEPSP
jgi:polar amino acid transport system substrate-binding protein